METFKLSKEFEIVCEYKKTRNGFKHTATLCENGSSIYNTKICYLNRTWESFTYESILNKVIEANFTGKELKKYLKVIQLGRLKENKQNKSVSLACAMGDILCKDKKEKNKWNKKMLNTIQGLDFPEDFDNLPEEEKERRIKGVLKIIKE